MFQAKGADMVRARPNERDALGGQPLGKANVLGKKAITWMNRLRSRYMAGGNDGDDIEIGFRGWPGTQPDQLVDVAHRCGETVGVGGDADGLDAEPAQRAHDARRALAAVSDQNRFEHGSSYLPGASQIRTRIGVGSKPLQGLLT